MAAIAEARSAGSFDRARGEAYYREQLIECLAADEKVEEARLLALLEEAPQQLPGFPDGSLTLSLDDS